MMRYTWAWGGANTQRDVIRASSCELPFAHFPALGRRVRRVRAVAKPGPDVWIIHLDETARAR